MRNRKWAPTQSAASCAVTAKGLTGFSGSKIIVHTTFLGGGLGRKIEQDYISQAIQTAMQLYQKTGSGIVKLMWPREEDFSNDQYRPKALVRVRAGLDSYGRVALAYRTVTPGISWRSTGPRTTVPSRRHNCRDSAAIDGVAKGRYGFVARRVEHVPLPRADSSGLPAFSWMLDQPVRAGARAR
jgi:isoquinoline 1-oxidoreductase beta subunit